MEPFVVEVLSNSTANHGVKLILQPDSKDTFLRDAYKKVYGHPATEDIKLAFADGSACALQTDSDLELLHVLSLNTLRATNSCVKLRVAKASEAWQLSDGYLDVVGNDVFNNTTSSPKMARSLAQTAATKAGLNPADKSMSETSSTLRVTTFPVEGGLPPANGTTGVLNASVGAKPQLITTDLDDSVGDVPSFLDDDEYARQAHPEDEGDRANSDCIWWLKESHPVARFFETSTMVVIIISVFGFVLETLPEYRLNDEGETRDDDHPTFFVIESVCIAWFTIEYAMRIYAAGPGRFRSWMWQPLNLIDLIAILPYYISFAIGSSGASSVAVVRILRLTRVTRLLKFSRHSSGLQDMIFCITHTSQELVLFFMMTIVASILFGSALFYCEQDADSGFISIPEGMWWAVITMTTVGYGDISPVTVQGKFVGAIVASLGVVLVAIPAGIFISEFMRLHQERKMGDTKFLKHEVILERLRDKVEETVNAVELYHYAREEYTKKLKAHYERKLEEAKESDDDDRSLRGGTEDGLRRRRTRTATETTEYNPQLYQINMDVMREEGGGRTQHVAGGGFLGAMANQ
eukprot:m.96523 g.96523  ORF g.96523 m.96523 type:complete len:578 (+) comp15054_c0_seq1:79-1812(+)